MTPQHLQDALLSCLHVCKGSTGAQDHLRSNPRVVRPQACYRPTDKEKVAVLQMHFAGLILTEPPAAAAQQTQAQSQMNVGAGHTL